MERLEHQKDLYKKLILNESFYKETAALDEIFKDSIWWASEYGKKVSLLSAGGIACRAFPKRRCSKRLRRLVNKAKKTKKIVPFSCGKDKNGMCFPVIQGDRIYGYILMCNSRNKISGAVIPLFLNFIDTLTRELQKELELAKLYQAIRPRAIALSTIHTVHRVISSTLNPDELLPKLARLCLQVLRAEECCIILKNHSKKPLEVLVVNKSKKNTPGAERGYLRLANKEKVLPKGRIFMGRGRLCVPLADEDVIGAICVSNKTSRSLFDESDREILATLSEQAIIAIRNARLYKEQETITLGSIKSLAAVLNTRTPGTYRVKESFVQIALSMGRNLRMDSDDLKNLHYAAILHDAGQITFPDELLTKTDKLTGRDHTIIKRHPHKGVSIIKHLDFLKPVVPIILHHHENFNGSGYPDGLKGERIPLGARIMAVAGAFSAMTTSRPYRQKMDIRSAVAEIKKSSGTQFDPDAVEAFVEALKEKEIDELLQKGL